MPELDVIQVEKFPEIASGHLFNSADFLALKGGRHLFFLLRKKQQPVARIWFKISNQKAISGEGATFGSVDKNDEVTTEDIHYFLKRVLTILGQEDITTIIIKHWPDIYYKSGSLGNVYSSLGFDKEITDTDQVIIVDKTGFTDKIKPGERQKIQLCRHKGYIFKILGLERLEDVYTLVLDTHLRKDYPVTMSIGELRQSFSAMPDRYLLFGLFDGEKLIAASVSIRVNKKVLYNFYHADDFSYRSVSPLVMLIGEIYAYCQAQGVALLDLGISSEHAKINQGLYNFKKNLGCITSDKITYTLAING